MSHDTHHHSDNNTQGTEQKSKTSFRSSFWFVVILVGLFIAAVNFVKVEGHSDEGEGVKKEAPNKVEAKEAAENNASNAEARQTNTIPDSSHTAAVADTTQAAKH